MKAVADLHIHSHYSRAVSENMNIETLDKYAKIKGLDVLGTGDFTHPKWFAEMKTLLREREGTGLYEYRNGTLFMLTTEVSLIYNQDGRLRKVHNVILAPSFEVAGQINEWLATKGNLEADGRPIFGKIACPELVEKCMSISKDIMVIPAHAWTPWFSLFGSNSGFDRIKDCFGDQLNHVHAIETGLSSDPAMNWRLSQLDNVALVSNSDCHSYWPWRLGREANVFELKEITYWGIIDAIKAKDPSKFLYTIETDPSYGKYHWDGHRACNVCLGPKESRKYKGICPVCGRQLTIGVLNRVEELADRPEGFVPKNAIPFKSILPLSEILAALFDSGVATKAVQEKSNRLIAEFGSELNVLLEAPQTKLAEIAGEKVARALMMNREGRVRVQPGYDGEYGRPLFDEKEMAKPSNPQKRLAEF
ncbi:MAG: endonuclease Q family protein [Candidatus Aenigmatarchaeota archaeon]